MGRNNSMEGRGKRSLEGGADDEEHQPNRKTPALVEAFELGSLQVLCSALEPMIRRVVREELARIRGRSSPRRIEGPDGRNLQLHFQSRLSVQLFTGGKVEGEQGTAVYVVLIDRNIGHVVTSEPESSAKLDIVTLKGDFNNEDWSQEEFESHVVKEREGKTPLLTGDLQVTLKEGVGTLGDLKFTDNSSWTRSRKFRLGLKVASGHCEGIRIREAKTEAFTVKDHRGELYKKHYPPALTDEVWRLEKIGKDGSFHKRLNVAGLFTVEDFLWFLVRDPQKLRNVLGSGMSNKMWDALREHARTCVLSEKLYVYYPDDAKSIGVVFKGIFELSGLVTDDQYYPADSLSGSQKADVDTWVKRAYDNWDQVVEYDGESMPNFKQSSTSQNYLLWGPVSYPNSLNSQLPRQGLAESALSEPSLVDPSMLVGGSEYHHGSCSNFVSASSTQHNQPLDVSYQTQTGALDLPQSSFQANINPFQDWFNNRATDINDFFSEDMSSLDSDGLLENEEMPHLIGGGNASINENEYGAGCNSLPRPPSLKGGGNASIWGAGCNSLPRPPSLKGGGNASINENEYGASRNSLPRIPPLIGGGNASINENEYGAGPRLRALSFGPYSGDSRFTYSNSMYPGSGDTIMGSNSMYPGSGDTIMGWLKIMAAMRFENEEMQDLIPAVNLGGNASINENEDGDSFNSLSIRSYLPRWFWSRSFSYSNSMDPGSGNTIMGWLKIKAAMRWGIFLGLVASVIAIAWIQVLVTQSWVG